MRPSELPDQTGLDWAGGIGGAPVTTLTLHFSKADDYNRIRALLESQEKNKIDPERFVVKRVAETFREVAGYGGIAFLNDRQNNVPTLTAAYRLRDQEDAVQDKQHHFTEIGTTLSGMPGYNSAQLVTVALVLNEWLNSPPLNMMVTKIKNRNAASLKTYREALKWEAVDGREINARVLRLTDETLSDQTERTPEGKFDEFLQIAKWYQCGNEALAAHARILLSFMNQGGLLNKHKNNHHIPVDFKALDDAGLTAPRLAALAQGETSRQNILQL